MGLLSGWFSSSSSAGKIEQPSKQAASSGPAAAAGKPNVWRSVFDPGSNPNIDRVGSAYYDTVHKVGRCAEQKTARHAQPRTVSGKAEVVSLTRLFAAYTEPATI